MRRAVAMLLALTARAVADPAAADRAIADANELAKAGDFIGAAAKFRAAYAADQRSELMCNVGVAYHKAKELPRAFLFLSRCLEHGAGLDAAFLDAVRLAVGATEAALRAGDYTPFEITVEPAGATIAVADFAADETFIGGHLVWLPFGHHGITVSAEGYLPRRATADAQDHEVIKLDIRLEREVPHRDIIVEPVRRSKTPALIASVATFAAVGVALVGVVRASSASTHATHALTPDAFHAALDDVDHWNHITLGASLVAAVGAAASTYLWIRAVTPQKRIDFEARADGAMLLVRGSF